jgi:hypothetical protein
MDDSAELGHEPARRASITGIILWVIDRVKWAVSVRRDY